MVLIKKSDVPQYLQVGSLFSSLGDEDIDQFEVPSECMKVDLQIRSIDDLRHGLKSLSFWGAVELPNIIYQYIFLHVGPKKISLLENEFVEYRSAFGRIRSVIKSTKVNWIRCMITSVHLQWTQKIKLAHIQISFDPSCRSYIEAAIALDFGLEMVRWLHKQGYPVTRVDVACAASADKHLDILKYFVEEVGCVLKDDLVTEVAIRSGSLECLKYLLDHKAPLPADDVSIACSRQQTKVLSYLLQQCAVLLNPALAIQAAAEVNSVACLRVLHENRCLSSPSDVEEGMRHAAFYDHLDCLKYLRTRRGASFASLSNGTALCAAAALGGQLQVLKYLRRHGCPWDERTKANALLGGWFECLEYAHQHGCLWGSHIIIVGDPNPKCTAFVILHDGPLSHILPLVVFSWFVFTLFTSLCVYFAGWDDGWSARLVVVFLSAVETAVAWGGIVLYYHVYGFR